MLVRSRMSGSSKVIVVYPDGPADGDRFDARAGSQIQLGFEREGIPSELTTKPEALPLDNAGLVLVGGTDGKAVELLRKARSQVAAAKLDIPIVFAGKGVRRAEAEQAGADEVVIYPAYLRDVVTVGRLLRGVPRTKREHIVGSLAETTGMFTLVRALAALGRSAVLTLVRGLRRGEIRFFHGEVTSAELALIHGQAALHQLLLWTEARFEFLHEDVVRRQQIPLSHEELFADAERFLQGVRDSSGTLSPSMVLEQDVVRIQSLGRQVPTEVHGVLRMFDGHRVLADILEDSPYRVFETLRVAQRAVEAGLLKVVESQRSRAKWRAVLSIEEWLTGQDRDAAVQQAASLIDSAPVSGTADTGQVEKTRDSKPKFKKGKKRKSKDSTPPPAEPPPVVARTSSKPDIDWGALVPRIVGGEVGSLSQVVPAAQRSGEISRERLEALDTGARQKIFPKDAEPSIVVEPEPDTEETIEPRTDKSSALPLEDKVIVGDMTSAAALDKATADKATADKATADKATSEKSSEKSAIDAKRVEEAKAIAVPPPRLSSPAIAPSRLSSPAIEAPRSSSPAIDLSPRTSSTESSRASSPAIDPAIPRTQTPSTPPRTKSPSAPPPITAVPAIPRTKSPSAPPPIAIPAIPRTKTPSSPPPSGVPAMIPPIATTGAPSLPGIEPIPSSPPETAASGSASTPGIASSAPTASDTAAPDANPAVESVDILTSTSNPSIADAARSSSPSIHDVITSPANPALPDAARSSSPSIHDVITSPANPALPDAARPSSPSIHDVITSPANPALPDAARSSSPSIHDVITSPANPALPDAARSSSPSIAPVTDESWDESRPTRVPTTSAASTESSSAPTSTSASSTVSPASAIDTVNEAAIAPPTPLRSIAPPPDEPAFLRTPPSTRIDSKFDDSDATNVVPRVEPEPVVARTRTPSAPPPIPAAARTKTPTAPPLTEAELKAKREAEQDAEDARLRAEAVELRKKQAAARAAEQDKQTKEAMDLAQRLADARKKAEAPLSPVTPDPDSVPISLATPDPDEIDESVPIRKAMPIADPDGSMPVPLSTPDPDEPVDEEALWKAAETRARLAAADQKTMPVPKLEAEDLIRELVGEKVTVKETNTSKVIVQEQMTIDRSIQTARIASAQITTVEHTPAAEDVSAATALFGKREVAAPVEIDDEPSDGIVRQIEPVETAPQKRPPPPRVDVADDRPGDRTGEITAARKKHASKPPPNVEPSILIEEAAATAATDVAAAHKAVAAVAVAQVAAPKTPDAAGAPAEAVVAEARKDAVAFSDAEEAFFRQGSEKEKATRFERTGAIETFDDLDEDYKPVGFWDRLRGKKPPPDKK